MKTSQDCDWIRLPIEIESDKEYIVSLESAFKNYYQWVKVLFSRNEGLVSCLDNEEKKKLLSAISTDRGVISSCIKLYYKGDVAKASRRILSLLKRLIKADTSRFLKSEIDNNYSTRLVACYDEQKAPNVDYSPYLEPDLTFFRARTSYYTDYREMYHIPLNKRDIVGTERFSIPGMPCLYLGASSYDVWLEMGRPGYSNFNVSAFKLTNQGKKLQVLNLVTSLYHIAGINTIVFEKDKSKSNIDLLKLLLRVYLLVIATSIRNKNPQGKFRSDYIISHLIMMNLKDLKIDGIAYVSKRIDSSEEAVALPLMVNFAFPAFEPSKGNKKYGDICEKFFVTTPVNYEEFTSVERNSYDGDVFWSFYGNVKKPAKTTSEKLLDEIDVFKIAGKTTDYHRTDFFRFDEYLCSLNFYNIDKK